MTASSADQGPASSKNIRLFRRMLGYIFPYWHLTILGVFLILVMSLSSSISIFMLKPIIDGILVKSKTDLIRSEENADKSYTARFLKEFTILSLRRVKEGVSGDRKWKAIQAELSAAFNCYMKEGSVTQILLFVSVFIILGVVIKSVSEYYRRLVFLSLNLRIMTRVRSDVYRRVMSFSMPFFNQYKTGYLMSRVIGEVGVVQEILISTASGMITNVVQVVFFLSIILYMDFKLTLLMFVCFPPFLFALDRLANWLKKYQEKLQELTGDVFAVAQEAFAGIRLIIVSNKQPYEVRRYEKAVDGFQKAIYRISKMDFLAAPLSEVVTTVLGLAVVIFALKTRVLNPASGMTSGDFIVYVAFMFSMMRPIKQLNSYFVNWQRGMVTAHRVYYLLDLEPSVKNMPGAAPLGSFREKIEFRNVTFGYRKEIPVLKRISLTIRKGDVLAVVGPSGAGKTTLVDLLPRLYDPDEGEVLIDGKDIRELTLESLRDRMGIVTQETILFHDTIRRNIAYGSEEAPLEAVRKAAEVANATEFIEAMAARYDTMLGERGARISGGERQRICIARAILRNPEILIFDEATSSLDNESEAKVQKAIDNLIKDRTAIVIAHRLSTIKHANKIIVIDQGELREAGTHEELMKAGGIYKRLYDLQFRDKAE